MYKVTGKLKSGTLFSFYQRGWMKGSTMNYKKYERDGSLVLRPMDTITGLKNMYYTFRIEDVLEVSFF